MVEIYGGGYTAGDKLSVGNPAGLISRSMTNGDEGVIYVAMNYRLGLFVSSHLSKQRVIALTDIYRVGFPGMKM